LRTVSHTDSIKNLVLDPLGALGVLRIKDSLSLRIYGPYTRIYGVYTCIGFDNHIRTSQPYKFRVFHKKWELCSCTSLYCQLRENDIYCSNTRDVLKTSSPFKAISITRICAGIRHHTFSLFSCDYFFMGLVWNPTPLS
jgi:hypothetical protein